MDSRQTVDLTTLDAVGRALTFRRALLGLTARVSGVACTGDVVGTVTSVEGPYVIVTRDDGAWVRSGSTLDVLLKGGEL